MRGKFLYCLLYVFTILSCGFTQSVWEWRNPLPQGNDLYETAYGNNQFVAVGEYSTILTSPDGNTWTERFSGTTNMLSSVTYGNDQFIAVGKDGTILSSKADVKTGININNPDNKTSFPLSVTQVSNRLFIKMPNTRHIGKYLGFSLFDATGRTIFVYTTKIKVTHRIVNFPISGLSQLSGGVYYVKITEGKNFEYYGTVSIIR